MVIWQIGFLWLSIRSQMWNRGIIMRTTLRVSNKLLWSKWLTLRRPVNRSTVVWQGFHRLTFLMCTVQFTAICFGPCLLNWMIVLTVQVEQGPWLDKLVGNGCWNIFSEENKAHVFLAQSFYFWETEGSGQVRLISKQGTVRPRTVPVMTAPGAPGLRTSFGSNSFSSEGECWAIG